MVFWFVIYIRNIFDLVWFNDNVGIFKNEVIVVFFFRILLRILLRDFGLIDLELINKFFLINRYLLKWILVIVIKMINNVLGCWLMMSLIRWLLEVLWMK